MRPIVVWLKEREPRNQALAERLATGRVTGGSATSRSEARADYDEAVASELAADAEVADEGSAVATRTRPTEPRMGASGGPRPAAKPVTPSSGVIPPRPRKKGKKR